MSDRQQRRLSGAKVALGWIIAAAVLGALDVLPRVLPRRDDGFEFWLHDTYYVASPPVLVRLAPPAAFLVFAVVYGALQAFGVRYNVRLARLQFWLMFLGLALVLLPSAWLTLGPPHPKSITFAFSMWNAVSTTGYVLNAGGLCTFIVLLLELALRSLRSGRSGRG